MVPGLGEEECKERLWLEQSNEIIGYTNKDLSYVPEMIYCEESVEDLIIEKMGLHEHAAICKTVPGKRLSDEYDMIISEIFYNLVKITFSTQKRLFCENFRFFLLANAQSLFDANDATHKSSVYTV
ncbi:hypothetical protein CHS0354_017335 [Potamilus streckersoni]|uniref:Uncharacterized protein n=1 Tax=Potamilus streckersoni TaxID=2493646 RepID=A0AAE0W7U0_9BIVA|nr:hypothetical protein CHS0354_017335 [Potamilus streckersoni]